MSRTLSPAQLVRELRRSAKKNGGRATFSTLPWKLYRALVDTFGSIDKARLAAGIAHVRSPIRWTRSTLISRLRELHKQGVRLTFGELMRTGNSAIARAAQRLFGGIVAAREAAQIEVEYVAPPPRKRWSRTTVVAHIRELRDASAPLSRSKVPPALLAAAVRHFGDWKSAIEASGASYASVREVPRFTKTWLINEVRRLAEARPSMTVSDFRRHKLGLLVLSRYDSLDTFLTRARLKTWLTRHKHHLPANSAVIRGLTKLAGENRGLTSRVAAREDGTLVRAAKRHFGSWSAALRAAGIPQSGRSRFQSRAQVEEAISQRTRRGEPVHSYAVWQSDRALWNAGKRLFGSYDGARRVAARKSRRQK